MKKDEPRKCRVKFKTTNEKKVDVGWVVKTVVITFTMSGVFNLLSGEAMESVHIAAAILILLAIIAVGIIFDIIGVAVTTAEEAPFHSMAASRVRYADCAIGLIKAKDKVSNFCNDVVGDICGIISGSAAAAVVTYILRLCPSAQDMWLSLVVTALVASLTVGGKAMGKSVAMKYSNLIVYTTARLISIFRRRK